MTRGTLGKSSLKESRRGTLGKSSLKESRNAISSHASINEDDENDINGELLIYTYETWINSFYLTRIKSLI